MLVCVFRCQPLPQRRKLREYNDRSRQQGEVERLGSVPGRQCRQEFGGPSNGERTFACDSACIHIRQQGTWQFMSTKLLTNPGSKHTITDDLESHYFVLMWTALHWVKHNQPVDPCIDMEHIFDQQRPSPGGIVKGGGGKVEMYGSRESELREVEFACKPFNELFWDLWTLFAGYFIQRLVAAGKRDPGPGEYHK
jgi:hypothetical protein